MGGRERKEKGESEGGDRSVTVKMFLQTLGEGKL